MRFLTVVAGSPLLCIIAFAASSGSRAQEQQVPAYGTAEVGATHDRTSLPDTPKPQGNYPPLPLPPRRLSFHERVNVYYHSVTSAETVAGPAFGAGITQWRDEPPEWGQGAGGFGDRFASGYGRSIIARTIRFGVAAVDHEDPRFERSHETGFLPRASFAVTHYFVPYTDAGGRIPAFSRFAGLYGAAFIANEWYPASRATTTHALLRGTTALSAGLGWNVLKEFWPDIKNVAHRHRP